MTGTLYGRTLSPAYAMAVKGIDDPSYPNQVSVFVLNQPDPCGWLQSLAASPNTKKANLLGLIMVLGETSASNGPARHPWTYTPSTMPDELTADATVVPTRAARRRRRTRRPPGA